jgi:hypothetical protein
MQKQTEPDYDARIIIDIKDSMFMVSHTRNIEMDQIYMILLTAIEYIEEHEFQLNRVRTLN